MNFYEDNSRIKIGSWIHFWRCYPFTRSLMKDFFISYNKADRLWATGIRAWLEDVNYSVVMQNGDFVAGSNFVLEMDAATKTAKRLIAILSPDYLTSEFTAPEWAAMFALDPAGKERRLIPVRVRECDLTGLLKQLVYIDLVGLSPDVAAKKLLDGLAGKVQGDTHQGVAKRARSSRAKAASISQVVNGNGNIQVGGDFHINTKKKVQNIIKPGPEHVTPQQATEIRRRLQTLGERDEKAGLGKTYGGWMEKFKRAFGITSYHLLASDKYEAALNWLSQQKGMTRSRLRRTNNQKWREEHYTAIHTVRQRLGWTKARLSEFAVGKGIVGKAFESLKELKERQLASLSATMKREGKK
jgi:hypothetical protein